MDSAETTFLKTKVAHQSTLWHLFSIYFIYTADGEEKKSKHPFFILNVSF